MRVEERRSASHVERTSLPARRLSSQSSRGRRQPASQPDSASSGSLRRWIIRLGISLIIAAAVVGSCTRTQTIGFYESQCTGREVLVQVVGDWPDQIAGWPVDVQIAARTAFGACVPVGEMRMLTR